MAKQSRPQKKTVERVMHEYKHGELKSGGGRKVKSPKQAIAIALSEAGASRKQSPAEGRRQLQRTKAKEARGETARARTEGRGGRKTAARAASTRGSSAARRGGARAGTSRARSTAARGRRTTPMTRGRAAEMTKAQLYQEARRRNIPGRSKMSKGELAKAVGAA